MKLLVTGGSGAFGSAFVRESLSWPETERVVVFSRDEHKQEMLMRALGPDAADRLRFFLGDVRDESRLGMALQGITHVVHAAALKIVPWLEYNPGEGIKTNIGGAAHLVDAAIRSGSVVKVVALSTDKACGPVNLYGATKLAAEKLFLAANALSGERVAFTVIRYGNVTGSTGSVVPLWRKLAKEDQALPITDQSMTRYWMTLGDAVTLVRKALLEAPGGEVIVPKLYSYLVEDLAKAVWREQNPTSAWACRMKAIGIRPGEKLHESMVSEDEAPWTYEFEHHFEIAQARTALGPGGRAPEYARAGKAVAPGFRYRSDLNAMWLQTDDLIQRLATVR